jgi:hypothetical protein
MADTIDLREFTDQVASMKQHIFDVLNACTDEDPINFKVEATFYDDYIGITLIPPRNRFDSSASSIPTEFKITLACYRELNELFRSYKFHVSNRVFHTQPPSRIFISVTYNK